MKINNTFTMLVLFIICLGLVHGIFTGASDNDTVLVPLPKFALPCMTPNGEEALCIEIQLCKVFMDALSAERNETFDFIRESRCGAADETFSRPIVCCGSRSNYDVEKTTTTTTTVPTETTASMTTISPTTVSSPSLPKDIFPVICGNQTLQFETRIVGGRTASLGEFPWMARLRHKRKDGLLTYGCAGFLVSEKIVVTAAHCIKSKAMEPLGPLYQVQLGEHDTERTPDCVRTHGGSKCGDEPQVIRTAKPIVHPEYSNDNNFHNDIAVIPLKQKAKFTEYVYPICLSKGLSEESEMWLAGWGKTESREHSPLKLKVSILREDVTRCVNLYTMVNIKMRPQSQFCAGGIPGRDSCSGDSGGPIMVNVDGIWYAEGIVSFGMGCGLKNWPGIYTNIPSQLPWITKVVNRYHRKQRKRNIKN